MVETSRQEKDREMLGGWGREWRVVREDRRRARQSGRCERLRPSHSGRNSGGEDSKITGIMTRGRTAGNGRIILFLFALVLFSFPRLNATHPTEQGE